MDRGIFEEEHDIFRDAARSFLQNEIGPHADHWAEYYYATGGNNPHYDSDYKIPWWDLIDVRFSAF